MFKYCVYTDGFFENLAAAANVGSFIVCDTNALSYMASSLRRHKSVKVCSIINSDKVCKLARYLGCTKSCIQLDVWVKILSYVRYKNLMFVIATSPTSLLRLLELVRARVLKPNSIIACPVGFVNSSVSKRMLWLSNLNESFLVIRGKLGGVAFGAAVLNSLARAC
ncbi:MAG: precorrin-8X methylmutase [Candidatus Hodgkinia cicadicola]